MENSTTDHFCPKGPWQSPAISLFYNYRGSWDEGRVAFCCWLRAQLLQRQSIGLPPGICCIVITLHALPCLELADSLPIFPPICRSVLQCPSPWEAWLALVLISAPKGLGEGCLPQPLAPHGQSLQLWGRLLPEYCMPQKDCSEGGLGWETILQNLRDVWMARCQISSWWPVYPYSTK